MTVIWIHNNSARTLEIRGIYKVVYTSPQPRNVDEDTKLEDHLFNNAEEHVRTHSRPTISLGGNETRAFKITTPVSIAQKDIDAISTGQAALHFVNILLYNDDNGMHRQSFVAILRIILALPLSSFVGIIMEQLRQPSNGVR